jgi:hypothetical protein
MSVAIIMRNLAWACLTELIVPEHMHLAIERFPIYLDEKAIQELRVKEAFLF